MRAIKSFEVLNLRQIIPPELFIYLANTPPEKLPKVLKIAVLDRLAPIPNPHKRNALHLPGPGLLRGGHSFTSIIPAIAMMADPAGPVFKMTPNRGDGFDGSRDQLLNAWSDSFREHGGKLNSAWSEIAFKGIERTLMYVKIANEAHFAIRTDETAGWANVIVQVNPRKLSRIAKNIIKDYKLQNGTTPNWPPVDYTTNPLTIGEFKQSGGHTNGLAFLSKGIVQDLGIDLSRHPHMHSRRGVKGAFAALRDGWEPDTYPQHRASPLQKGIGVVGFELDELVLPRSYLLSPKGDRLKPPDVCQRLKVKNIKWLLEQNPNQVFICVCSEPDKVALFMGNGIPGAAGGIGA